jgi:DNA (cytosine-5)-methyltransferase 1
MVRTHLDLFSGIGGFALAARWAGLETIQFVEIDSFAQKVLKKNFPGVPIHDDIKTFDATQLCQPFLLTGGYPCQPFSQAGKRRGKEDDRHLWPEMLRVIRECRPTWICAENVAGHLTMGLDTVLADLESEDYSTRTFVIPACAKDAPHRRDRVWIVARNSNRGNVREIKEVSASHSTRSGRVCQDVAYSTELHGNERREHPEQGQRQVSESGDSGGSEDVADSNSIRQQDSSERYNQIPESRCGSKEPEDCRRSRWIPEPSVGRVAHGIPSRVDRLRGLGNAIVPQVAYEIIHALKGKENETHHCR